MQASAVTVDNSKLVVHSISSSLQRLEHSVKKSMDTASKLMEKKLALEMGTIPYSGGRESSKKLAEQNKAKGPVVLPDVVTEVLKRAKIRSMYER